MKLDQEGRATHFQMVLEEVFDHARFPACVNPETILIFPPGEVRGQVIKEIIQVCEFQYSRMVDSSNYP